MLQHHHVRVTEDVRLDLQIWKRFLLLPQVFSRHFIDTSKVKLAKDINMYSDASGCITKGAGAYCGSAWTVCQWDKDWFLRANPSIEFLELYGVAIAVLLWIKKFKNSAVKLHCDNECVCRWINNSSSSCKNSMILIRIIVLECLVNNVDLSAEWVSTKDNGKADALSRLDFRRFRKLAKNKMNLLPEVLPHNIWPIQNIWIK